MILEHLVDELVRFLNVKGEGALSDDRVGCQITELVGDMMNLDDIESGVEDLSGGIPSILAGGQ